MSFTYTIDSQKIGGERIIGTIPSKVAIYWLENHADDFEDYFWTKTKTTTPMEDGTTYPKTIG